MALRRVTIGFEGGQALATRISDEALTELHAAVQRGSGWHEVSAEDGTAMIDLEAVVYVTTDASEHRVGFGL